VAALALVFLLVPTIDSVVVRAASKRQETATQASRCGRHRLS
jgi:hypothetical protein